MDPAQFAATFSPRTSNGLTPFDRGRAEGFVSNAGWNSAANASEIRAAAVRVGAFVLAEGGRDSAILVSLSSGPYTIQVSGANNTSGIALVEVYEVP